MAPVVDDINFYIQARLRRQGLDEVPAIEAATWLDEAGLLKDSGSRPGLPLRKLLRTGRIRGAIQRPETRYGRWYIGRSEQPAAGRGGRDPITAGAQSKRTSTPPAPTDADEAQRARRRRARAAEKYRPTEIKLLLVAEAPPAALDRYFYFDDVREQDSLFRYIARSILKAEPTRANKSELLGRLRDRGVFLTDLKQDPVDGGSLEMEVSGLVRRIRKLDPGKIIVIKASVYDLVYRALVEARLPVVDQRVPFPGSGQQRRFEALFGRALTRQPVIHR
jgi:hypothetical protein